MGNVIATKGSVLTVLRPAHECHCSWVCQSFVYTSHREYLGDTSCLQVPSMIICFLKASTGTWLAGGDLAGGGHSHHILNMGPGRTCAAV